MIQTTGATPETVQYLICVSDFVVMRDLAEAIRGVSPSARITMTNHASELFDELPRLAWPGLVFLEGDPRGRAEIELLKTVRARKGRVVFVSDKAGMETASWGGPVLFLPFRSADVRRLHEQFVGNSNDGSTAGR